MFMVAAQTFRGSSGGIARLCDLMARTALEEGYATSLLSVADEGGRFQGSSLWRGCGGSRLRFLRLCLQGGLSGRRIFYDQLGTARAQLLPSGLTKPSGVWLHGIEVWTQFRKERLRAACRMAYILANTRFTQERAIERNKIFENSKVCWLATSEDDRPLDPAHLSGPPVVLILGRFDEASQAYKGHRQLIEVWPIVCDAVPGARLIMVGTGPSLEWHRSLAKASKASGQIDILGFVPDNALHAIWRRAVVFAMPSQGEGFGLAYIEAMRWGVPVIASTHDAGSEINVHGQTGLNVNLYRKDELSYSIIELLRNRDLAQRMGAAGSHRWREHFRYSSFRARFEEHLRRFHQL
jgi:phosphatidyl-myo-inositol dimannoside synthase